MQKFISPTKSNNKEIIIRHQHNKVHHYYPEKQKQLPQLPLQQQKKNQKKNDWNNSKEIPSPPKVKLSGYLKKKRNKVGGWRKMWFVLQDQLLLSYSSKDEYDKKLVSFKDVLNLVPGTVVQPLGGSRFTIETTSSQLYTFRCDDTKACTEWITALSESLALKLNSNSTKDLNNLGLSEKHRNKSLDNIQQTRELSKKHIRNSYSCDSIVRTKSQSQNQNHNNNSNGNKLSARIPIAESTARILQRNGVSSNDMKKSTSSNYGQNNKRDNYNIKYQNLANERARNFRLHEKRLSSGAILNQSDEVSRINRMFSRSTTNIRNSSSILNPVDDDVKIKKIDDQSLLAVNKTKGQIFINYCKYCNDYCNRNDGVCNKNHQYYGKIKKSQYLLNDLRNLDNFYLMATNPLMTITSIVDDTINNIDQNQQLNIKKCQKYNSKDINENNKMKNYENCYCDDGDENNCKCENYCDENLLNGHNNDDVVAFVDDVNSPLLTPVEDQIQRLSLKDIPYNINSKTTTLLPNNSINTNTNSDGSRTRTGYTETEFPLLELKNFHYLQPPSQPTTDSNKETLSTTNNIKRNSTTSNSPITSPSAISTGNNISPISTSDASTTSYLLLDAFSYNYNSGGGCISSSFANGCGVGGRRLSASSDNINKTSSVVEPIYAVVDLKNKYARRARIRELQEEMATVVMGAMVGKDKDHRPNSIHCVTSSDYEEVLNFSSECLDGSDDDDNEDENENIYEPINIPEYSCHHHHDHNRRSQRNALWKYFPRLNIDALIEMARNRTKNRDRSTKSSHTSLPINDIKESAEQEQHHQSSFSDFRKKMGNHRKSIKLRMKKFYGRSDHNCPNSVNGSGGGVLVNERNAFSDDELDSQGATGSTSGTSENSLKSACAGIGNNKSTTTTGGGFVFGEFEKYRRGEKQFFGSLSRLKKTTRASLCLEDDSDSCKKKTLKNSQGNINNNNNNNSNNNNNNNCNDFDEELKREVIRRSGRKVIEIN